MSKFDKEFQEIGHCGGRYILDVQKDEKGRLRYSVGYNKSSPGPAAIFAVYALQEGIPVGTVALGGIGAPFNAPPHHSCYIVFIASDREQMFGNFCHRCKGYWRSSCAPSRWKVTCPYCGVVAECHHFRTPGQIAYIEECCELISKTLTNEEPGEYAIDLDKVADEISNKTERPKFYYVEESQQNRYRCESCGGLNDILGHYGYCSCCGTRNVFQMLKAVVETLREQTKKSGNYVACNKEAVGVFDSLARSYAKQLVANVPMTSRRRNAWQRLMFHNLEKTVRRFSETFDIEIARGLSQADIEFITRMFHRRHVYEHNGGEVDEKYIQDSGDTNVRLKQMLHETAESAFRTATLAIRMAENLHRGFHDIFPPQEIPVRMHQQYKERLKRTP